MTVAAPLAFRLAGRELRAGLRGFRIFLACLALGVAAIAAAGSVAEAFRQGLASQAREILGGDLSVTVRLRTFSGAERAIFARAGAVAYAVSTQAMAQAPSGERRLAELRGVSDAYPLAGAVELRGGGSLAGALAPVGDAAGAAVEAPLLERLVLKLGDRFLVGNTPLIVRAVLASEPDRLSRGFALGPRVLIRLPIVEKGGFVDPGLPFGETARIALPAGANLKTAKAALEAKLKAVDPVGGFRLTDRADAAPGLRRLIDELEYFLGFIGLASLVAGGLGVFGAVSAHLEARTGSIAVLKALGAEGGLVRDVYLIQIGLLAILGVIIGLAIGAIAPLLLGQVIKDSLPVPALFALYPVPLARAGAFGLLAAAAFSLGPLARARETPPAALFRRQLAGRPALSLELLGAGLAAAGLAGLAIVTAPTPMAAAIMMAGVAVAFVCLWALGIGGAALAGRLRASTRGAWRIGLANLAGPGSAARSAAPAIGLGVALLSVVVLIQSSLLAQVSDVAPRTAPSLVFSGIPAARGPAFEAALAAAFGRPLTRETFLRAPFASGRIVAVRGLPVDRLKIDPSDRWAYDNDISLSALGPEPLNAGVTAGRWWPANYAGPPLLAVAAEAAKGGALRVGDGVTLEVLGRQIDARVAVVRKVDFAGFGASFPLVLDPAALAGADLRNVAIARATPQEEARATRALGRDFPEVNVISVREALGAAADLFDRLALAIRGAAAVAALAGLLVLAGAIAARARARGKEAAVLKVLGASTGQILCAYGVEYGAVGLIAGGAGVALGYAAAWPVVVEVFRATWSVDWTGVAGLVFGAAGFAAIGGLLAAIQALSRRPAPTLRAE
jgi:putative ABC transport system permease protein